MNQQNNVVLNNSQYPIEDLTVNKDQAAEVKGGPIEIKELQIKVVVPNP